MPRTLTVDQAVAQVYLRATGKVTPLTFGTTKYTKILALLNFYTQEWALEAGIDWNSLRQPFPIGTVTATDTFSLDTDIGTMSQQEGDFVRISNIDGVSESEYTIVPPSRLYEDGPVLLNGGIGCFNSKGTCAISNGNLVFSTPFLASNPEFGGTIKVPGFIIPPALVGISDQIIVDDPNWLVVKSAAEYDRNDVTRVQLYPALNDEAAVLMENMKDQNQSQAESAYTGAYRPLASTWE
jgi:hypothetical protein